MSDLYNKASLVMTPQLVDTGKVYSIKPEDRKGDFTFTRSSAATRVNADGNIEKETQNFLLQSNNFDVSANWLSSNVSETGGQAGYDGTNNAWLVDIIGGTLNQRTDQSITANGVITFSVYAKAGSLNWISLRSDAPAVTQAFYDLSTGSLGSTYGDVIDSSIEAVGNGWYRCSMTIDSTLFVRIYPATANGNITQSSGNIYIQDAQLEQGLVARDYIETTTTAVEGGITDNVPRLDYTDSSCPALLLEPQRTNLITQSEYFGDSYWVKTNVSITSNSAVSPSGITNAAKLTEDATNAQHKIYSGIITAVAGDRYTQSFFAKSAERNWVYLEHEANPLAWFNLSNGTIGATYNNYNASASIQDYGNGWYRCIVSYDANDTTSRAYIGVTNADNTSTYLGDGSSGAYIWGAQVEAGSYATSYIPTYGSSVTRVAEACDDAGDITMINSTEGVLYVEISGFENDLSNRRISLSDGTANNSIRIFYYNDGGTVFFRKYVGGVQTSIVTIGSINQHELTKIAIKYNSTNFDIFANGVKISTNLDSNSFPTNTLNKIGFANGSGTGTPFYGKTKQVLYFPTALTDQEAIALTTI